MANPKECQGRGYHTPSAANPMVCYRCHMILTKDWFEDASKERYTSTPISDLPTGDMGD